MDQVKEEAWYICKDVVDSVASKIILPLDFAVINQNEQTLEQTGEDNTSIDWFWNVVKAGEHLMGRKGLGEANSFIKTSAIHESNKSLSLPACLSSVNSTSKTQTPQPNLTDSTPVDWTSRRVHPNDSIIVSQLLRRSNRNKAKGEEGTPRWLKMLDLETMTKNTSDSGTAAAELPAEMLSKTNPKQTSNLTLYISHSNGKEESMKISAVTSTPELTSKLGIFAPELEDVERKEGPIMEGLQGLPAVIGTPQDTSLQHETTGDMSNLSSHVSIETLSHNILVTSTPNLPLKSRISVPDLALEMASLDWEDIEDNFKTETTKKNVRRKLWPLSESVVTSEGTFLKHQPIGKCKEEDTKPRSRIPRAVKLRGTSTSQIDGLCHSRPGTPLNLMVNWHNRKDGLLPYMRPTKSSLLKESSNKVGKTTRGKDVRPAAAKPEWKNIW